MTITKKRPLTTAYGRIQSYTMAAKPKNQDYRESIYNASGSAYGKELFPAIIILE